VLAVVVVAVAGCGKSAEHTFRDDTLHPLQQRAETRKSQVSATLKTVRLGSRRDARALRSEIDSLGGVVRQIAALTPPSSAVPAFRRYTRAYRQLVARLRSFAAVLGRGDHAGLDRAGTRAQEAAGTVQRSEQALIDTLSR
jgi:hypothetical protein